MTPLLLTLASLTPGDGGPGGAARAPVAVKVGDGLKGFIRLPGGPLRKFELRGESLCVGQAWVYKITFDAPLDSNGEGRFRLFWRHSFKGTIRLEGNHIVLTLDRPPPALAATAHWYFLEKILGDANGP